MMIDRETTPFGETKTYDLKKDGGKIPLTNENRKEYVDSMVQWYLEKSIEKQMRVITSSYMNREWSSLT
jgi:hypothetical protein